MLEADEYHRRLNQARIELDALKPVKAPDLGQATKLLRDMPSFYSKMSPSQKQKLFQAMLERVYVRGKRVVGLQPKAEFYPLLMEVCLERTRRDSSSYEQSAFSR
jgi:hypothetical protein